MKKMTLVFLIATLALLSGCNGETNNAKDKEKKDLVWYNIGTKQRDDKIVFEEINRKLREKIGVGVELRTVDTGSYSEKMNLVINSGEKYDMCFTSSWANSFMNTAPQGAYAPLNEFLSTTAKGLKESLPEFVWEDATLDGKIYAIPNYQVYYYQQAIFTPKKLVDKYNLDVNSIKNKMDIEPYLNQLLKNENEIYPFDPISFNEIDTIGTYDGIGGTTFMRLKRSDKDYKLYNYFELPQYKKSLEVMRDWYKKGYIRKDVLSVMTNNVDELKNLKYGVFRGSYKPGQDQELKANYGEEIVCIPLDEPFMNEGVGRASMNAISARSENKQDAIKALELFNTDKELYNMLCFGLENTHYTKVSSNKIKQIEGSNYWPNIAWAYGNQFNALYMDGQEENIWDETDKLNRESKKSLLRGFNIDLTNISTNMASIDAIIKEYKYIECGAEEPQKLYDEFMGKLKKAGIDDVIKEVQKQVDEFCKGKK